MSVNIPKPERDPRWVRGDLGRPFGDVGREGQEPTVPSDVLGSHRTRVVLRIVGLVLLVVWGWWWFRSVRHDRLVSGGLTWVPILPFLAGDFKVHISHTARLWAEGRDVYRDPCDWVCDVFPYPPMVPRLFSWVSLTSTPTAIVIWLAVLSSILAAGTWAAWRTRCSLGLNPIPLPLALAAVLYSAPVLFTLERGQSDGLVVIFLLAAAWLLQSRSKGAELAAGGALAVAAWIKYYPGLTLLGLVAMRRWRSVAGFVLLGVAIGAYDATDFRQSIANGQQVMATMTEPTSVHTAQHSILNSWQPLWKQTGHYGFIARVPSSVAAAGLLVPLVACVTFKLARSHRDNRLIYPYFLWLVGLATFTLPLNSNDYNLFFLPLGVVAVWDRRDPVLVHMVNGLLMLWWQPFWLPIGGELMFAIKLAGLATLGVSLVCRAEAGVPQRAKLERGDRSPTTCSETGTGSLAV